MRKLLNATKVAVESFLGVQAEEKVLVIVDEYTRKIGYALWEQSKALGAEAILMEIIPRKVNREEPPFPVAEAMKQVDVIFAPTSYQRKKYENSHYS